MKFSQTTKYPTYLVLLILSFLALITSIYAGMPEIGGIISAFLGLEGAIFMACAFSPGEGPFPNQTQIQWLIQHLRNKDNVNVAVDFSPRMLYFGVVLMMLSTLANSHS